MPEGLSAVEAGKGLSEHAEHDEEEREKKLNRTISIFEAALLAVVAVLAAWSGYAAAKFSTDSSLLLAKANGDRAQANAANLDALNGLNFDLTTFNDWFTAYVAGNKSARLSLKSASARTSIARSKRGWPPTRKPTRMPRRGRPICRNTTSPRKFCRPSSMPKQRRTTTRAKRRGQLGQLCPYDGLPGHRSIPRRYRQPFFVPDHPLWPGRVGSAILILAIVLLATACRSRYDQPAKDLLTSKVVNPDGDQRPDEPGAADAPGH